MMRSGMTVGRMILREVQSARLNTLLCLFTVVLATGLLVAMVAISQASVDATRVMMKRMGFNLLITPESVDPARYQALDFQEADMPEDYIGRLASSTVLAQHFVGKYQKTVQVDGCTAVLTGVLKEVPRQDLYRKPMPTAFVVPRGHVFLGSALAQILGLQPGDSIEVLGSTFTVDRVLDEVGVIPEDIRIFAHLHDAQEILGKPGRINAIDALSCYCPVEVDDILGALEASIRDVLPDVNVRQYKTILLARQRQRAMMQRLESAVVAIILAGSATAIWILTYLNVRSRRREIGTLRALGVPDRRIAAMFIGKIIGYSVLGTALGCAAGVALVAGLPLTEGPVAAPVLLIAVLLFATPAATVLFGLPPIVSAFMQEPVEVLREAAG